MEIHSTSYAAGKGHTDVKFLSVEKNCRIQYQGPFTITHLHLAVLEGHMQVLSFLIDELKCPPDIIGQREMTPYVLLVGINNSDESVVCIIYTCFYQYLPMNQVSAIQLGNCNHCVGVVARCALLRHAFTAQITTTCSQ